MNAQKKGIEVKTGKIIGVLVDGLKKDKYDFLELLRELTLAPYYITWHLQWWGQEDDSFVCILEDSGGEETVWSKKLTIVLVPKEGKNKLVSLKFCFHYEDNGFPLGNEKYQEEFEVDQKSDEFTRFSVVFRKIQQRWKIYQRKMKGRRIVNEKRAKVNMPSLFIDEIEP